MPIKAEPLTCFSCLSSSGERRISPGRTIYTGEHWLVEHTYLCGMVGWLVIVLRRHEEALHELSPAEWAELGILQQRAAMQMHCALDCEKEYVMGLAEVVGFQHIHFHVVAKLRDLPAELTGTRIFAMLKVSAQDAVPPENIAAFCEQMQMLFAAAHTNEA